MTDAPPLRVVTWNVGNPSTERARAQCQWIAALDADVIALTEMKASKGSDVIRSFLEDRGLSVVFHEPPDRGYAALLAVRGDVEPVDLGVAYQPWRAPACRLVMGRERLQFCAVYVPSRGPVTQRNVAKRAFQQALQKALLKCDVGLPMIVAGDLNVVEPGHEPPHDVFGAWEYEFYDSFGRVGLIDAFRHCSPRLVNHSWVGRSGKGYRFDHIFVTRELASRVLTCSYDHGVRSSRLSDHAAMSLELAQPP